MPTRRTGVIGEIEGAKAGEAGEGGAAGGAGAEREVGEAREAVGEDVGEGVLPAQKPNRELHPHPPPPALRNLVGLGFTRVLRREKTVARLGDLGAAKVQVSEGREALEEACQIFATVRSQNPKGEIQ